MKHFSSYYQNAYGQQNLQGGDMLRGALNHKYAWYLNGVILWVTWQIKYISQPSEDVSTPH